MEHKYITKVKPGDKIKHNGGKAVEVKEIEFDTCGSGKVHINGNECFDALTVVTVWEKEEVNA